ncbi:MAG: VCBS repeat-containing protein, partial [Pseudomonadota bacterium]
LNSPQTDDRLVDPVGLPVGISIDTSSGSSITLTGSASAVDYAAAIALIQFENTGDDPDVSATQLTRTIDISVTDGHVTSNTAQATITIVSENDVPVVTTGSINQQNTVIASSAESSPRQVVAADLDGDSDIDLAVVFANTDAWGWMENDGSGGFTEHIVVEGVPNGGPDSPRSLAIGDIDGVGGPDVVVVSLVDDQVRWYPNDGSGNFGTGIALTQVQAADSTFNSNPHYVETADLNKDGHTDIVVAFERADVFAWYEGDGAGGFEDPVPIAQSSLTNGARILAIADLNSDTNLDLVGLSLYSDDLIFVEGDGTGGFAAPIVVDGNQEAGRAIAVADINGDGNLDIVSSDYGLIGDEDDTFSWFAGDGAGNFGSEQIIAAGLHNPVYVTVADIDSDGDVDVIGSITDRGFSPEESTTSLWFNDGNGNFGDEVILASGFGLAASTVAVDVDGDLDLDVVSYAQNSRESIWLQNDLVSSTPVDTDVVFSTANNNAITVSDVDVANLNVTITVTSGTLNLTASGAVVLSDNGPGNVSLDGTVADINATLEGMAFTPALGFTGQVILTVTADDGIDSTIGNRTIEVSASLPPLVIDLDGDGVEFIGLSANYQLDVNGDGSLDRTAWANADDAILVYDLDADGRVSGPEEFVFTRYVPGAQTDLEGLRYFDSNQNGWFDSSDQHFADFALWQDRNLDGAVSEDEWMSLEEAGVQQIALTSDEQPYIDAEGDVTVHGTTTAQLDDGTELDVADASFVFEIIDNESPQKSEQVNPESSDLQSHDLAALLDSDEELMLDDIGNATNPDQIHEAISIHIEDILEAEVDQLFGTGVDLSEIGAGANISRVDLENKPLNIATATASSDEETDDLGFLDIDLEIAEGGATALAAESNTAHDARFELEPEVYADSL